MEKRRKAREGAANNDDDDEDDDDEDLYKLQELSSSELCPELTASEYRVFVDVSRTSFGEKRYLACCEKK